MAYDSDDDDRPRRRRSRRRRKRGSGVAMWVTLGGLGALLVVGVVVAVVVLGQDGAGGVGPGAREITAEEFRAIKKEDTLASLEARFGPAKRLGPAELDNIYISEAVPGHDRRFKISFARRLRETWNIANPECYHWSGGGTKVYIIPAQGHPTAKLHLKWYIRQSTNERGEFHGETSFADMLNDGTPPPLQPPGK